MLGEDSNFEGVSTLHRSLTPKDLRVSSLIIITEWSGEAYPLLLLDFDDIDSGEKYDLIFDKKTNSRK